jgi:hypothetical protein
MDEDGKKASSPPGLASQPQAFKMQLATTHSQLNP